jgi:hypothetical protein
MTTTQTIQINVPRQSSQRGKGVTARYNRISFRLSDMEAEALRQVVKDAGMTQADFLTQLVNSAVAQLCKR